MGLPQWRNLCQHNGIYSILASAPWYLYSFPGNVSESQHTINHVIVINDIYTSNNVKELWRKNYLRSVFFNCSKQILCHLDKTKSRPTQGLFSACGKARSQPGRGGATFYFLMDRDWSLISTTGKPILVRWQLYIEPSPRLCRIAYCSIILDFTEIAFAEELWNLSITMEWRIASYLK